MINGVSSYELSSDTRYLSKQISRVDPSLFQGAEKSFLFLGSGDGQALNELASQNPDWSFCGIDFNRQYVESALKSAPSNAKYVCANFSEIDSSLGVFGVIASCGLLSWIPHEALDDVFSILKNNSAKGGFASFGYDSEFFWGELKGIRETFLDLWLSLGDMNQARMITHGLVSQMTISTKDKSRFVAKIMSDEEELRHWLYQPHWQPFFPSEIDRRMKQVGFETASEGLNSMTHLMNPQPYIHSHFRRAE